MTALGILNMREDNRNRDIESDSYMLDSAISDSDHGRFQRLPFAKELHKQFQPVGIPVA